MTKFLSASRVLAAAASSAWVLAAAPSQALTITVNSASTCTASVVSGNVVIDCSSSGTPSCSVSASPSSLDSGGGNVTLTSNCGAVSSWTGAKAGSPGTSTSWTDTLPANTGTSSQTYVYSVSGANGTASTSVTVAAAGAPPPPVGDISCTNIPGVKNTKVVALPWSTSIGTGINTKAAGGFGPSDAFVFVVQPPAGYTTNGKLVLFKQSPTDAGAYNNRMVSISTSPCDFTRSMGSASLVQGQEATLYFTVGGYPVSKYGTPVTTNANLTGGNKYYITIVNQQPLGSNTCSSGSCNVNYGLTL
jgi:hypothetical protein